MTKTIERDDAVRSLNAERLELLDEIERHERMLRDQRQSGFDRARARNLAAIARQQLRGVERDLARLA